MRDIEEMKAKEAYATAQNMCSQGQTLSASSDNPLVADVRRKLFRKMADAEANTAQAKQHLDALNDPIVQKVLGVLQFVNT